MILLTNPQKIYIASAVISALLVIILVGIFFYKRIYAKKHFKEVTYLRLSRLSRYNDYLLLNNYRINFDEQYIGLIDHVLISKKYIFVINDFSISGVITGSLKDRSLRVVTDKTTVKNVSNPLNYNINLIKRLNLYHRLDRDLVIGLVIVNDDSDIKIEGIDNSFMMIRRKDIAKTIHKFEKSEVKNLKENDVINFINKLDKENKKYDEKLQGN